MFESKDAIKFVRILAQCADRMAERNLVVNELLCHYGAFGSWLLEVRKAQSVVLALKDVAVTMATHREVRGRDFLRFVYDGRDSLLTASISPSIVMTGPANYRELFSRKCRDTPEAVKVIEDYIDEISKKGWPKGNGLI